MMARSLFAYQPIVRNEAGGVAYAGTPKEALAQLASTSCLNNTLYCSAEKQLDQIQKFANQVDPEFVAKTAVFSREKFKMKDVPALLCACLAASFNPESRVLLRKIFPRVIDNGDMLRKFFEIIRPGKRQKSTIGRSSFGTVPRKLIIDWFNSRTPTEVFEQSIGTPSMRDILRCVRPRPLDRSRSAMYAWFVGKTHEPTLLPSKVQHFEQWKNGQTEELPNVPFQMLTNTKLSTDQWTVIAQRAGWKWLLKNVNNMIKHGVFKEHPDMVDFVAQRLSDRKSVHKASTFPYQILTAYQNVKDAPQAIQKAFHCALDIATENVPLLPEAKGNPSAYLFVDVSKSMTFMVTGNRYGIGNRANTSMTRADVAALIACSILRKNTGSEILLFNTKVVDKVINPKVSVLENSTVISKMADGGTACSAPLHLLNEQGRHGDLVITVSDDQSWAESMAIDRNGNPLPANSPLLKDGKTAFQHEWDNYKVRNPNAKLVCIDIAPYTTKQVQKDKDVLNIGGFSDVVFDLCGSFAAGTMNPNHLVGVIENVNLDGSSCERMLEEVE